MTDARERIADALKSAGFNEVDVASVARFNDRLRARVWVTDGDGDRDE